MYFFSKKIKCLDCEGNYRGINERGKRKYICSYYHNYRTCTRWKVEESFLIELIYNHYEIDLIKNGSVINIKSKSTEKPQIELSALLDRVESVQVSPKLQTLTIRFKDGSATTMKPNQHTYYKE
jgi:hypothetical protein